MCGGEVATCGSNQPAATERLGEHPLTTEARRRRLPAGDQIFGLVDPAKLEQRLDVLAAPPPQVRLIPAARVGCPLGADELDESRRRAPTPQVAHCQDR